MERLNQGDVNIPDTAKEGDTMLKMGRFGNSQLYGQRVGFLPARDHRIPLWEIGLGGKNVYQKMEVRGGSPQHKDHVPAHVARRRVHHSRSPIYTELPLSCVRMASRRFSDT